MTKRSQTNTLSKEKIYKTLIFYHFTQQNLIIGKYLPIFNENSEQKWFDKTVFNNLNRLNHSSPMRITVINKIKRFRQLFALGPQIPLKQKWYHILS